MTGNLWGISNSFNCWEKTYVTVIVSLKVRYVFIRKEKNPNSIRFQRQNFILKEKVGSKKKEAVAPVKTEAPPAIAALVDAAPAEAAHTETAPGEAAPAEDKVTAVGEAGDEDVKEGAEGEGGECTQYVEWNGQNSELLFK